MRAVVCALLLACLAASAAAGGDNNKKQYSKYNFKTTRYEPIFRDTNYVYYRSLVKLNPLYIDQHDPTPALGVAQTQILITGEILDVNHGDASVGRFETTSLVVEPGSAGVDPSVIVSGMAEIGPDRNDAIAWKGGFQAATLAAPITDHDIAIVGGTNQYMGAIGQLRVVSINGLVWTCEIVTIVPRVRSII